MVVALLCATLPGVTAPLAAADKDASFVLDANSGQVLHDDKSQQLRHPASLTKMMTLYLLFEALESGRTSLSTRMRITSFAASAPPSNLKLDEGDSITVSDAIRALVTKSANDVARAVAEHVAGSKANFVRLMNQRARQIGMKKTVFTNPSGLPDRDQVTTARDMITLGLRLQDDFPKYYPMFSTKRFSYRGKSYRNHNTLLNTYSGVDGIKTGYVRMSGFNVVTNVRRGSRHVVAAVFGGKTAAARNAKMRDILNRTMPRAATRKTWSLPRPDALVAQLKSKPRLAARPRMIADASALPRPRPQPPVAVTRSAPQRLAQRAIEKPVRAPFQPAEAIERATAAAADTPAAPLVVEVAKVRRVAITPRQPFSADEVSDTIINSDDPIGALAELHAAKPVAAGFGGAVASAPVQSAAVQSLVAGPNETLVPKRSGAGSYAARGTIDAVAAIQPPSEPAMSEPAAMPAFVAEPAAARIMAAAQLPPRPVATAQRPAPMPATARAQPARFDSNDTPSSDARASGYLVQIGAYVSETEAMSALTGLQRRIGGLLDGAAPVTQRVASGGKTLYRARFSGFNAASASRTCTALRRKSVDCFVTASN